MCNVRVARFAISPTMNRHVCQEARISNHNSVSFRSGMIAGPPQYYRRRNSLNWATCGPGDSCAPIRIIQTPQLGHFERSHDREMADTCLRPMRGISTDLNIRLTHPIPAGGLHWLVDVGRQCCPHWHLGGRPVDDVVGQPDDAGNPALWKSPD